MDKENVRAIAQEVAAELARKLTKTRWVMSKPEVAEALGYSRQSSAIDRIIAEPDFPQPIDLADGNRRKWLTKDIEAWLEARREAKGKMALAAFGSR